VGRRAVRASAGTPAVSWTPIGASTGSMVVACGMRPSVGFSTLIPQHWAGQRSEPSPSLPSPNGLIPVASAAASPPLDAPGVRDRSHGFTVAPHSSLSVCQRRVKLGQLVRPIGIAPAARIRSTTGASRPGYAPARALSPTVVGVPARSMFSYGEGDAVERRWFSATGDDTVGYLRGFEGLLAQDNCDGVDRGVHGLDPPEVGLDDFLTGRLPGSDRRSQVRGAHPPEVGGRFAHACPALCRALRRRTALAVVAAASAPSAPVSQTRGRHVVGRLTSDNGCPPRSA
jgi:hypothetical protein